MKYQIGDYVRYLILTNGKLGRCKWLIGEVYDAYETNDPGIFIYAVRDLHTYHGIQRKSPFLKPLDLATITPEEFAKMNTETVLKIVAATRCTNVTS